MTKTGVVIAGALLAGALLLYVKKNAAGGSFELLIQETIGSEFTLLLVQEPDTVQAFLCLLPFTCLPVRDRTNR